MKVPARKRSALQLEQLEDRLSPAQLTSASQLFYQDTDGDIVRVTLNRPILKPAIDIDQVFLFDVGLASDGDLLTPQQLVKIDLSTLGTSGLTTTMVRNLSVTVAVHKKDPAGDGRANVGELFSDVGLGQIQIAGDLSKAVIGDGFKSALALKVISMGVQPPQALSDLKSELNGNINTLNILGNLNLAQINVTGFIHNLTVTGSFIGGTYIDGNGDTITDDTGSIIATGLIGHTLIKGSIFGADGLRSGSLRSGGKIASIQLDGRLVGGVGEESGRIASNGAGRITTRGIIGSDGDRSGQISSNGSTGQILIQGGVVGGDGEDSGQIVSQGRMLGVKITNSLQGGAGLQSGSIRTEGFEANIILVAILGSVTGGSGNESGAIVCSGTTKVRIDGDLNGGSVPDSFVGDIDRTGYIQARRLLGLFVVGSIRAGNNPEVDSGVANLTNSGSVRVEHDLGPVRVSGSIIGSTTNRVTITARGQVTQGATTDLAINSISVRGFITKTDILAGYEINDVTPGDPIPENPDAQIGVVQIGGGWIATNLVAGSDYGGDHLFGTLDDFGAVGTNDNPNIVSKIGAITIHNTAVGTDDDDDDHFGIVAQWITSLTINRLAVQTFLTNRGPNNNTFFLTQEAQLDTDFVAHEVGFIP